jgi:hypothetical protein
LTLVVDSTDLVAEIDESDNVFQTKLVVLPAPEPEDQPLQPARLPDLAPIVPPGWPAPIIASAYSGAELEGPLSVKALSYIRYAIENQGLASAPENVHTQLYFDGTLVSKEFWSGAIVGNPVTRSEWDGLSDVVTVTPGEHTLRLLVDPHNLITESDETNNSYEVTLRWDSGEAPALQVALPTPIPDLPDPPLLPNLVPGLRFGWDGALIASNRQDTYEDGQLIIGEPVYIDMVVRNESSVELVDPYQVLLYFDDTLVKTLDVEDGTPAGSIQWWPDWDELTREIEPTEGVHILRMEIDRANRIPELDESDNTYVKEFEWRRVRVPPDPLGSYSDDDVSNFLSPLRELVDSDQIVVDADDPALADEVLGVAAAGYHLLTGKRIIDQEVDVSLLTHQGFIDWLDDSCAEDYIVKDPVQYQGIRDECERAKSEFLGFTTIRENRIAVVVDAERKPAAVINTLAHELGHMNQHLVNPEQSEATRSFFLQGILEAEAQQFQRSFWLALEEWTGLSLLAYPDHSGFHSVINQNLEFKLRDLASDEHSLGFMIQWLAVLDDPLLSDLRTQLLSDGALNLESSIRLHEYFFAMPGEVIPAYVDARMQSLSAYLDTIEAIATSRLVLDMNPDTEGVAKLRAVGLLTP